MTEDISVQDIANALNISRSYLSHEFKKEHWIWIVELCNNKETGLCAKADFVVGASVTEACLWEWISRLCTFHKKLYKDVWYVHQNNTEKVMIRMPIW